MDGIDLSPRDTSTYRSPAGPDDASRPKIRILGTRGIPCRHGGFESFAEDLAPFLVARGWDVTVYCQEEGDGPVWEDSWQGVRLVHIPVKTTGAPGTVVFDWKSTRHALSEDGLALVLGYNTAVFSLAYRLRGVANVLNMDGMEWKRAKYSLPERAWFYLNEWLGCYIADHLVADHPVIEGYLAKRVGEQRVTMIPYGARSVSTADTRLLNDIGISSGGYALVIARPEPENSILEVVRAFSRQHRGCRLVVLGNYSPDVPYQRSVLDAASDEVVFAGAIYDRDVVDALRYHTRLYVHGHTVGGTNPALVEAMGGGTPVLAHDNPFNRWVAGPAAAFFADEDACAAAFDRLLPGSAAKERDAMAAGARRRHMEMFALHDKLSEYERLLAEHIGERASAVSSGERA